uniref:Uncharacterized protein n=1 Tax=Triticum urartu TaxID=4572 RepID=A0A8R7JVY6_TRIUA
MFTLVICFLFAAWANMCVPCFRQYIFGLVLWAKCVQQVVVVAAHYEYCAYSHG